MKKFLRLTLVLMLALAAILLVSCGGETGSGKNDVPSQADQGSLQIGVVEADGTQVAVGVDEDTDVASYTIVRDDNATKAVKDIVAGLRKSIESKTGVALGIKTSLAGLKKAIYVGVDTEMGPTDYSITKKSGKLYIKAGAEDTLSATVDMFVKYFIYAGNKSLLIPAGDGYIRAVDYFFSELTVDGVSISEFKVYADPETNKSGYDFPTIASDVASAINEVLWDSMGCTITSDSEFSDKGHYIIVYANNVDDVNKYSIEIKDGNIHIRGSYVSVQEGAKAILTELGGYKADSGESGKKVALSAADSREGSMNLTVPYDKAALLSMFEDAYERDDMIVSGSHVWASTTSGPSNGFGIAQTEKIFGWSGVDVAAILELDVGQFSSLVPDANGEDLMLDHDLSRLVSEALLHVSKGGIISVAGHWANPISIDPNRGWYKGVVGTDKMIAMTKEGTEENEAFRASIDTTLELLKALSDNGIPFMTRPLHEMNADWFWWCLHAGNVSSDAYVTLWRYYHDLVTKELGITEVVWVYAPSVDGGNSDKKSGVLVPYPGDEYVDIVGMDWYTSGGGESEYNANDGWENLMSTGKPVALTEFDPAENESTSVLTPDGGRDYFYTGKNMLEDFKAMMAAGHKICYFETWTWSRSCGQIKDCEILMNDPIIYTRSDMLEYWNNH